MHAFQIVAFFARPTIMLTALLSPAQFTFGQTPGGQTPVSDPASGQTSGTQAAARVVKNASVQFITGDDGKDDSDVFSLVVANASGKFLERVYDAREEIKPGTTFNLWLNRIRAEPSASVSNSHISFRIDPKGSEHWVVTEARLTVNYESGPAERWHWGPFVLQTQNSVPFTAEFLLSDEHRF
jgi:hypothetical protein